MAIKVMRKGQVICDGCHKLLALIESSSEVFMVLENETKYTIVTCTECAPPNKKINKKEDELSEKLHSV